MLPSISNILKSNLPFEFIAVGVVWAVIAGGLGLAVVLWPALTCLVAGLLLKLRPSGRLTWPWAISSATLGLLVSGYQAYAAVLIVGGTFSLVAAETLVAFTVFALIHLILLYTGYSPGGKLAG